jgi:4-hydroxy-4-methyl-2-oxoglutarate aldolase
MSLCIATIMFCLGPEIAPAPQSAAPQDPDVVRSGKNFIPTPVYSEEEDRKILALFAGLRVADVVDGMDKVGLPNTGSVDPAIHALWKDTVRYAHRIAGIAVTARYVPTNKPSAAVRETGEFDAWVGSWYTNLSPEPFVPLVRPGTVLVIEDAAAADVGSIGSNNILAWKLRGCAGVVTNAGARDTDEITAERVPLYFKQPGRGIRPGRNEIESVNRPVVVGGVLVVPGDVVVADGDGVAVVPRAVAQDVAAYARATLEGDKEGRRGLYRKLGLPPDDSVK